MKQKKIHYGWFMFIGCCLMQMCIVGGVVNSAGLFYAPICNELGFGRGDLTVYATLSNLGMMVSLPFWGKFIKKYNLKVLLSICLVTVSGSIFVMSRGTSLWHWYVAGSFLGLGNGLLIMLITPVILSNWFEKNLGLVTGIAMSFSGIGGAIINPIGAKLIETFGWRTAETIIALIPLVIMLPYVLVVYRLHPKEKGLLPYGATQLPQGAISRGSDGMSAKAALKCTVFPMVVVFAALVSFGVSYPSYLPSIADDMGQSVSFGASLVSLSMLGNVTGKLLLGWLNDRLGVKGAATFGCGGLILAFSALIFSMKTNFAPALLVGSALTGFAMSVAAVMLPLVTKSVFGNKDYGTIYSYVSMGSSFATAVSASAIGYIFDFSGSYVVSFLIGIGIYVLAILCLYLLYSFKSKQDAMEKIA